MDKLQNLVATLYWDSKICLLNLIWLLFTSYSPAKEQNLITNWDVEFWINSKNDQLEAQTELQWSLESKSPIKYEEMKKSCLLNDWLILVLLISHFQQIWAEMKYLNYPFCSCFALYYVLIKNNNSSSQFRRMNPSIYHNKL